VEHKALDPAYRNHPFLEPLTTLAEDRGQGDLVELLQRSLANPALTHERGDTGKIERGQDKTRLRFQDFVDKNNLAEVEATLKQPPELALDPDSFWGEGVLAMPAKCADRKMIELLMTFGARVPDISKWGARYYFKHYEIAAFLLDSGMNPNHM